MLSMIASDWGTGPAFWSMLAGLVAAASDDPAFAPAVPDDLGGIEADLAFHKELEAATSGARAEETVDDATGDFQTEAADRGAVGQGEDVGGLQRHVKRVDEALAEDDLRGQAVETGLHVHRLEG